MNYEKILDKVPSWLIAATLIIFVSVILEQIYNSKECVNLWGLKLNQSKCESQTEIQVTKSYWWRATMSEGKNLMKTEDGICFLTHVSGPISDHKDLIGIYEKGGYWQLTGTYKSGDGIGPSTNRMSAQARCIKLPDNMKVKLIGGPDD